MMKTRTTLWLVAFAAMAGTTDAQLLDESLPGGTWQIETGNDPTLVVVEDFGNLLQLTVASYRLEDLGGRLLIELSDEEIIELADTRDVVMKVTADVRVVECNMGQSHDFFAVGQTVEVPVIVRGNAGKDMLFGTRMDDELYGGHDADVLVGGPGKDSLFGGADGFRDEILGGEDADLFAVGCSKTWRRYVPDKGDGKDKAVATLPDNWWKLLTGKKIPDLDLAWVTANVNTSEPILDISNIPMLQEYCVQEDLIRDLNVNEGDIVIDVPVE